MTVRPQFGFALEYVTDVEQVKRFYVDVLGLAIEREHPQFVQFTDAAGAAYAIASDEAMGDDVTLELYWVVDDASSALAEIATTTEITFPLTEMPFGKVFGITDPAGQPRYLVEFAKERPSKQVT